MSTASSAIHADPARAPRRSPRSPRPNPLQKIGINEQKQQPPPRRRRSVFKEVGLSIDSVDHTCTIPRVEDMISDSNVDTSVITEAAPQTSHNEKESETTMTSPTTSKWRSSASSSAHISSLPRLSYIGLLLMVCALVVPALRSLGYGPGRFGSHGVEAAVIHGREPEESRFLTRQSSDDPSSICKRWSHQSAIVNGTLYIYGGRAMSDQDQTTNQWNNDFLSMDLGSNIQIGSPTLKSLPSPSGPPAVANGYLWNSVSQLFLYGGEFSDTPIESPTAFSTWEYDIPSSKWNEHENPQTSGGNNSESSNQPVQRSGEGAGVSIPEIGLGFYFGGHLDFLTTQGWSNQIARVYLKSLLEFTFPGYTNTGVEFLSGGQKAGDDGVYRNITQGGLQAQGGFPERADGILVYIPGWGEKGIILGLAGGTNTTFTQMNVIDVYDIANSTWYKQATSGTTPKIRVNPCAVVAAAADGSSFNVHMYGGQNLQPYEGQTQYDDLWILSVPSFNWIQVDTKGQSNPPARAGHSCDIWNGQMVVVGGYVGQDLTCDSPGVYVFDLSTLKWQTQYTALKGGNDLNQQATQQKGSSDKNNQPGLSGSFGYQVPPAVQSVIGGHTDGGATVTAPVQSATSGPLATGTRPTFTVTQSNGAVVTETGAPGSGPGSAGSQQPAKSGPNIGAIVAGVVAGCFAILAGYFAFCAWVYRRQLKLYKNHVAMAQRQAAGDEKAGTAAGAAGLLRPDSSHNTSNQVSKYSTDASSGPSSGGYASVPSGPPGTGDTPPMPIPPQGGNSTTNSSSEDLMAGQEPSFLGVLLSPRRSLRVINRD
ncbi:MAG: hypothetical protein M4579_005195 [Chaenotheca gracillima]|nr:MAG: hypothetical protein M4579_005195 [Chaenotheca gracillima]